MNKYEALEIIDAALAQLPPKMTSDKARVQLLATAMQESQLIHRRQMGNGPARGFWQFELGTRESRGGVWGVYLHPASAPELLNLCSLHKVAFLPQAIYAAVEFNDVFAAGVARLMYWTVAAPVPEIGMQNAAWLYYLNCWRPGKPHPEKWPECYLPAVGTVRDAAA